MNDPSPQYEIGQIVNGHRWTGLAWEQVGGSPGIGVPAPGLAATIWISILFGPFGAIPASRDSARARARGLDGGRYWKAFWISWLASWLAAILIPLAGLAALGILVSSSSTASAGSTASTYADAPRAQVLADIARHCELMTPETAPTPEQTTVQRDLLDSMDPDELLRLEAKCLGAGLANRTRDGGTMGTYHFAARNSYLSLLTSDGRICLDPRERSDAAAVYDPTTDTVTIGPRACR